MHVKRKKEKDSGLKNSHMWMEVITKQQITEAFQTKLPIQRNKRKSD